MEIAELSARETGVRRMPVQQRSVERFERVLDACAQLLDEVGVESLTTRAVADRAGVPIGTLYQFFDGKTGLLRQLALRNLTLLMGRLRVRADGGERLETWSDLAECAIHEVIAMRRTVPGFAAVDFEDNRPGVPTLLDESGARDTTEVMADWFHDLGTRELGLPEIPERAYVLRLAMEAAGTVLWLPFRNSADGDPRMIEEAVRMVRLYLDATAPRK